MRFILAALLLVVASANAENINDLPLYGGFPKTPAMIKADQEFVEKTIQVAGSKEAALENEIMHGWQSLRIGKTIQAIRHFNQAYLLEPENADVYWGLGAVQSQTGEYEESLKMFNRAYKRAPKNVRLVADIGLARTRYALGYSSGPEVQKKRLESALLWFDVAERIDPAYPMIYANRAITLTFLERYPEAWKNVEKAESLNRSSVDSSLVERLSKAHPRPERTVIEKTVSAPQSVPAVKESDLPEEKMSPRIREVARTGGSAPVVATSAPQAPVAQKAPRVIETKTLSSSYKVIPRAPKIEFEYGASEAAAQQGVPQRRLEVISGKPDRTLGSNKRHCLSLPTNDAIIRCVYPSP